MKGPGEGAGSFIGLYRAPGARFELATLWLTATCSAD